MKKFVGILLILALLCAMSVPAFAASENTISTIGGTKNTEVKGTYIPGGNSTTTVYSVDITWGSMEFTYTGASQGEWDPKTHQYENIPATWSFNEDANVITVTNHSNAAVKATFAYNAAEGFDKIHGTFSKSEIQLTTAVGTEVNDAPSGSVSLELDGALDANTAAKTTIGTVTVTLAGN